MVEHEENEVHIRWDIVQLVCQPLALGAGGFVQRAVEHEH